MDYKAKHKIIVRRGKVSLTIEPGESFTFNDEEIKHLLSVGAIVKVKSVDEQPVEVTEEVTEKPRRGRPRKDTTDADDGLE